MPLRLPLNAIASRKWYPVNQITTALVREQENNWEFRDLDLRAGQLPKLEAEGGAIDSL